MLYVLDGNMIFPIDSLAAQGMVMHLAENHAAPLLIVGVGYFGEDRSDKGNAPPLLHQREKSFRHHAVCCSVNRRAAATPSR